MLCSAPSSQSWSLAPVREVMAPLTGSFSYRTEWVLPRNPIYSIVKSRATVFDPLTFIVFWSDLEHIFEALRKIFLFFSQLPPFHAILWYAHSLLFELFLCLTVRQGAPSDTTAFAFHWGRCPVSSSHSPRTRFAAENNRSQIKISKFKESRWII